MLEGDLDVLSMPLNPFASTGPTKMRATILRKPERQKAESSGNSDEFETGLSEEYRGMNSVGHQKGLSTQKL
ncbi:hypothetical protein V6N12_002408 [Hibiscus sabdariffa]|uniref:Uncharacterized protein n=1 Tax=Hibiscus sabdariffa TaxID=183260 RepID=A0ABR2B476_9ROSI